MNYYVEVLQKYMEFNGRAGRSEFGYFFLINLIIMVVLGYVGGLISLPILGTIYGLAVFLPNIAVTVRRMHDLNQSAWYLLVLLIPFVNLIYLAYLLFAEGTNSENGYGAPVTK